MYKIVEKRPLSRNITLMQIEAPLVAKKAQPGQFVILRATSDGERIPLTISGTNAERGTVCIIFQIVGATTRQLNTLEEGDCLADFAGPLGKATELDGLKKVCVVGGGVGCAIAMPIAQKLHDMGCEVHSIVGFRNHEFVSYGEKGVVTAPLKELIESGEQYDMVIAIGPLLMMKFVVETTRPFGIPTTVSMNPIMIDGTGMCGGCRLTVGGETKFACVDGPDFDGFKVDFDEAMKRTAMYRKFERHAYEATCNLLNKEAQ